MSVPPVSDKIQKVVGQPGYREPKSVTKAKAIGKKLSPMNTASGTNAPIPTPRDKAMFMLITMHTVRPSDQKMSDLFKCQMEHYCDSCRTFHKCVGEFVTLYGAYHH